MRPRSIIPATRLLEAGRQDGRRRYWANRPDGTEEWILLLIEAGTGEFRYAGGAVSLRPGQIALIAPGTSQDYGSRGGWKNTWVHFFPRPDCLAWMQWPAVAPGFRSFRLGAETFRGVRRALGEVVEYGRMPTPRAHELAVNALERAILLCSATNPPGAEAGRDPRVQRAAVLMCRELARPHPLAGLARACGISRSHLLELFQKEMKLSPRRFLEQHRLRRARQLLTYTPLTLKAIADEVGFSSPFYLSLRFKKHFGLSPRAFRAGSAAKRRSRQPAAGSEAGSRRAPP